LFSILLEQKLQKMRKFDNLGIQILENYGLGIKTKKNIYKKIGLNNIKDIKIFKKSHITSINKIYKSFSLNNILKEELRKYTLFKKKLKR
jgi:ribosomal protein S13